MAFPPGSRVLQIPEQSISKPKTINDEVLLSELDDNIRELIGEVDPTTLKDTLDAFASQIRQIVWGTLSSKRWTDLPPITIADLASYGNAIINEEPSGLRNCSNVDYTTALEFLPGTLEVWLGSAKLTPAKDYTENINFQGFHLITTSGIRGRLKLPPSDTEDLLVNYRQRIIF